MENKILKSKIILLIFTGIFLAVTGYFYRGLALSTPFVDEMDNFAIGKYLLKGEVLYEDILTNHQPTTYILSALAQKTKNSNTTFSLLLNQRTAIIFWAFVWSLILVYYFGFTGFLFVVIFEFTKGQMLGNLFLAESTTVYPLVFFTGAILFNEGLLKNKRTLFLLGLSLVFSIFTLLPLWPLIIFLFFIFIFKFFDTLAHKKNYPYFLLGIFTVVLVIFKFSSISGYLNSLYLNYAYTVPSFHEPSLSGWSLTFLKSFITPVFAFFSSGNKLITFLIKTLTILLALDLIYLLIKRRFSKVMIIIISLGLANLRFINPGVGSYNGFHLLPWFGVFIFITLSITIDVFKQARKILYKSSLVLLIIIAVLTSFYYAKDFFPSKKIDFQKEYTKNYSTHTDLGQVINIMKQENDTLFVSPNAWLLYWQADTLHLPKLYGYYAWMSGIPEIHNKILETFSKKPPTFFYCEDCKGLDLEKFFTKYKQVMKNEGKTYLYVLPERLDNLSEEQKRKLKFYGIN